MPLLLRSMIAVLLLFTAAVYAQETAQKQLEELQETYRGIDDFRADVVQQMNGTTGLQGELSYKAKNKFKIETPEMMLVSNAVTNWNLNKKQKKVIISAYDPATVSLTSFDNLVFEYPSQCSVGFADGGDALLLKPEPGSMLDFSEAVVSVNAQGLIGRVQVTDFNGNQYDFSFNNIRLNQGLRDADFTYEPEGDVKVIDLR